MVTGKKVTVIGGGLAGCEAAFQLAERDIQVTLYEMKPARFSPAHESDQLAELVCSNSFRANAVDSSVGLLKEEMRQLDSLIMKAARHSSVPAGKALAVDRHLFAAYITAVIGQHPHIQLVREEVVTLPDTTKEPAIMSTGPLSSEKLTAQLVEITGEKLAFYDAIAPIVDAESLNRDIIYQKSRWDDEGPGDYLNCPMSEEEYDHFYQLLMSAETVPLKAFEQEKYFEGCLPIEVMGGRGVDTLRFGPMKPVGLDHPVTGERFHAVVQLRAENRAGTMYNLVGFQTKLKYNEQRRVFRSIPGLEQAEFLRMGSIHRNTFICAPALLDPWLQMKQQPGLFIAGQLSGVEGYVESAAMGLLAGINVAGLLNQNQLPKPPPSNTALGALITHLTMSDPNHFQPSNVNFGLFPPLTKKMRKKDRGMFRAKQALESHKQWCRNLL
ncbi:MAG: methylenetetrahydrofolate--tRNA-(uracil(54)-C(5))-methyltransferase (FADH(2)-oxidizing) TrmFO [Desulfobulbus propionicus]|nr:MAG: methylenetetrahydrofolate--tRNA-(uracil(54)-C(5))-methyltransferase (FADH(2)-oxidizing) TrmFO [Desulfobulbus propionicus]